MMSESGAKKPLGIYIHIPFCVRKCRYCDFLSLPVGHCDSRVFGDYVKRLISEIHNKALAYGDLYDVDSIYIGGGTPSLLPAELISALLTEVYRSFSVAADAEISMEANPGTIDREKAAGLSFAGINRISLGVQSLDDNVLKALGRIHDSKTAMEAYSILDGFNRNVDLMFGLPGQTELIWEDTLKRVMDMGPEHISFYSLQIEEGTPFYDEYRAGALSIPTWEENRLMYANALRLLKEAGYRHYEISNAARPGFECRHNLKYWTMSDYMGIGAAAHSFLGGSRHFNTSSVDGYIEDREPSCSETQTEKDLVGDFLFTELRLIDGFALEDFSLMFGHDITASHGKALEDLVTQGLLEKLNGRIRLTAEGLNNTNAVMAKLINV